MNRLLIFFFLNFFASQAQKDSVRLVDFQSSECGETHSKKPHFLSKETIGDTTYISLSCSNYCNGYHDPFVSLHGDSVEIRVPPNPSRCDCCFTYNMKIIGLGNDENYKYFYNKRFVDPTYKGQASPIHVEYQHFLNEPRSTVLRKIKRVVSNEKLRKLIEENGLTIYLDMDTVTCSFKEVIARCNATDTIRSAEQKLSTYFQSLSPACIFNPNERKIIEMFLIEVSYDENGKLEMRYEPGEPIYTIDY